MILRILRFIRAKNKKRSLLYMLLHSVVRLMR